ncbi:MAG: PaaI family thioesterase [Pseudomonadota bacterium]
MMQKTPFETHQAPPVAKLLGWKLIEIDLPNRTIELEFEATNDFLNPSGHVQGGILCAMLDDTLGPAVFAATDFKQQGRTIDLHTHFVRPAFPGKIRGKGKVTRLGKTVAFMEGQLFDPDEKLIARATGSAMLFDFKT